jgi:hypothetical protein
MLQLLAMNVVFGPLYHRGFGAIDQHIQLYEILRMQRNYRRFGISWVYVLIGITNRYYQNFVALLLTFRPKSIMYRVVAQCVITSDVKRQPLYH